MGRVTTLIIVLVVLASFCTAGCQKKEGAGAGASAPTGKPAATTKAE